MKYSKYKYLFSLAPGDIITFSKGKFLKSYYHVGGNILVSIGRFGVTAEHAENFPETKYKTTIFRVKNLDICKATEYALEQVDTPLSFFRKLWTKITVKDYSSNLLIKDICRAGGVEFFASVTTADMFIVYTSNQGISEILQSWDLLSAKT